MSKLIPISRQLKAGDMVWIQQKPNYIPEVVIVLDDQMANNFNGVLNNPSGLLNIDQIKDSNLMFIVDPPLPNCQVGQPYRISLAQNGLNVGEFVYNNGTREFTVVNEQNKAELIQKQSDGYRQNPQIPTYILQEYKPKEEYMAEMNKTLEPLRNKFSNLFNPFGRR